MSKAQKIYNIFVSYVKKNKDYPTIPDLVNLGVNRDQVRASFGSLANLKAVASRDTQKYILDLDIIKNIPEVSRTKKTFVITTAVTGAKVNTAFLNNLKAYCKKFNAQLLVLVSFGSKDPLLDPILNGEVIIKSDCELNSNIYVLGIKNGAKQADPITGLPRVGRRNGSVICPSPKQRLKYVATGPSALPHALMSTGAVTDKNYLDSGDFVNKNNYIADHDHTLGAVVVELEDGEFYHFRQIQADKKGSFCDLNVEVKNGKIKPTNPSHLVLGDWHSGETNLKFAKATDEFSSKLKIGTWVLHDAFSATSCSHHDMGKKVTLAKKQNSNKLNLKSELDGYCWDLYRLSEKRNLVIVKSNHDEHLERYLNEGRYVDDPENHRLALDLAAAYMDGRNPLKYYFNLNFKRNNIIWLERDEDYSFKGIHLGAHGDKGANGSKGGINSMENAYGKVVYGHTHTPEILREAWCVGTSTDTSPDYGSGPSSWMNTHCIIHNNGTRQLINFINNKFTTRKI